MMISRRASGLAAVAALAAAAFVSELQTSIHAIVAQGSGPGGAGAPIFSAADANKDGSISRDELRSTFDRWFTEWSRTGPVGEDRIVAGLNLHQRDVDAMIAALPAKLAATPKQPRKVLVLGKAAGWVHTTIPLAAKTVEALGSKTGAWSTTITYDPADINAQNLRQYDAIVLASTTGRFLDDPNDAAATTARKKALLEFIRGGKGIVGIHAASDSYHGDPSAPVVVSGGGRGGTNVPLSAQMVAQGDKNNDHRLSKAEFTGLADAWFDKLDPEKTGTISQAQFGERFGALMPPPPSPPERGGGPPPNVALWPEWNKIIGGFFKFHWNDPQLIVVKIDDPKSPVTAMFNGPFEIRDETYTYVQDSFSRDNVHVLTSVDYSKMSDEDKAKEPASSRRTDGDYALSWIRREGKGRLFYEAHGHSERVYAMTPMLEHIAAGIQYAIGDLKADDTPSGKAGTK
jgi:type 1 glutamine amidotransferase